MLDEDNLFGLDSLTDLSSDRCEETNFELSENDEGSLESCSEWPSPQRTKVRTDKHRKHRQLEREQRIKHSWKKFRIFQSRHWHLSNGRKCMTGFKGRTNQIKNSNLWNSSSNKLSPQAYLDRLELDGYETVEIRYAN